MADYAGYRYEVLRVRGPAAAPAVVAAPEVILLDEDEAPSAPLAPLLRLHFV